MAERVILACLCIVFGGMAYVALGYSLGDVLGPGAGFFPFWLGVLGVVFSISLLIQNFRDKTTAVVLLPRGEGARRAGALLVGLVVAALMLQPLGFRLTMLIFTAGLLAALGVRRPVAIAIFALVSSFGLFHVFYYWLQVPLPIGLLGI
jgi:hypothetical protein